MINCGASKDPLSENSGGSMRYIIKRVCVLAFQSVGLRCHGHLNVGSSVRTIENTS